MFIHTNNPFETCGHNNIAFYSCLCSSHCNNRFIDYAMHGLGYCSKENAMPNHDIYFVLKRMEEWEKMEEWETIEKWQKMVE